MLQRKTEEFDSYARESVLAGGIKNPSEENEESIAREIIRSEQERLGLKPSAPGTEIRSDD